MNALFTGSHCMTSENLWITFEKRFCGEYERFLAVNGKPVLVRLLWYSFIYLFSCCSYFTFRLCEGNFLLIDWLIFFTFPSFFQTSLHTRATDLKCFSNNAILFGEFFFFCFNNPLGTYFIMTIACPFCIIIFKNLYWWFPDS